MIIEIDPIAKPRMTQRDKWAKRDCVLKYYAFKDELKLQVPNKFRPEKVVLVFNMPMPKSWSDKKKEKMCCKPHQVKPDIDNLIKGFLDALYEKDQVVYDVKAAKFWAREGFIDFEEG